jgi:hypothetical protein
MSTAMIRFPLSATLLALSIASSVAQTRQPALGEPETVIATYRVRAGKEAEFAKVHAQAWLAYRRGGLVLEKPHLVLQGLDETGKTYFVEILSWKTHEAPDHTGAEIQAIWTQMQAFCEARSGHAGIEFPEVKIVTVAE